MEEKPCRQNSCQTAITSSWWIRNAAYRCRSELLRLHDDRSCELPSRCEHSCLEPFHCHCIAGYPARFVRYQRRTCCQSTHRISCISLSLLISTPVCLEIYYSQSSTLSARLFQYLCVCVCEGYVCINRKTYFFDVDSFLLYTSFLLWKFKEIDFSVYADTPLTHTDTQTDAQTESKSGNSRSPSRPELRSKKKTLIGLGDFIFSVMIHRVSLPLTNYCILISVSKLWKFEKKCHNLASTGDMSPSTAPNTGFEGWQV